MTSTPGRDSSWSGDPGRQQQQQQQDVATNCRIIGSSSSERLDKTQRQVFKRLVPLSSWLLLSGEEEEEEEAWLRSCSSLLPAPSQEAEADSPVRGHSPLVLLPADAPLSLITSSSLVFACPASHVFLSSSSSFVSSSWTRLPPPSLRHRCYFLA